MKIRVIENGKEKQIEIPFWYAFKVFFLCYLAMLGMFFALGLVFGIFGVIAGY
jgi:hypothetical protein